MSSPIAISQMNANAFHPSNGVNLAVNPALWSTLASVDTGSTLLGLDRQGGGMVLDTDATDNDENQRFLGGEAVEFGVGKRGNIDFIVKGTEGSTDKMNWFVGLSDVIDVADFISDSDALAAGDTLGIMKLSGSMFARTVCQNASSNSGALTTTAWTSAAAYRGRIAWEGLTGGLTARFYFGLTTTSMTQIGTVTGVTYTSLGNMQLGVMIKNGAAAAEKLEVHYLTCGAV